MPPTTKSVKSPFVAAMGARGAEAVAKHANDDTQYGFVNLPPGIDQGIAQLTQCSVEQYKTGSNKGQFYLLFVGNVYEPFEATAISGVKIRVKGLQTRLRVDLFDLKNSKGEVWSDFDRQFGIALNEMRKLGGPDFTKGATIDDIEPLGQQLVEAAPFFRFSTTPRIAQKDEGGVKKGDVTGAWENWHGTEGLEDYVPEEVKAVAKDNTGPAKAATKPSANGAKPTTNGKPAPTAKTPEPDPEPPFSPEESTDLAMLCEVAKSDTELAGPSGERLVALAVEAGIPEKQAKATNTWDELVEMIESAGSGTPEEQTGEDGGLAVGSWVGYHPKNPVTKKPAKDAVRCSVTAVNGDKVDLKAGKATYKSISVDDLVEDPGE